MINDKNVNNSIVISSIGNERFLQRLVYSQALSFFAKSNMSRSIKGLEPSKRFGIIRLPSLISLDWEPSLISLDWEPSLVRDKVFYDLWQRCYTEDSKTPDLPFPISYTLLRVSAQRQPQKQEQQLQGDWHLHPVLAVPYLSQKLFSNKHSLDHLHPVLAVPYLSQKLFSNKHSLDMVIPNRTAISIHTGSFANRLTNSLGANAVTIGRNIFFARGKYNPKTPEGLALIVHELTHIKQQQNNTNLQKGNLGVTQHASLEKEALGNERKALNYFLRYSYLINNRYKLPAYSLQSNANSMIMSDRASIKMSENPIPLYETRYIATMANLLNSLPFSSSNLEMKNNANHSNDLAHQAGGYNPIISKSYKNVSLNGLESSNSVELKYSAHPNQVPAPKAVITPLLAENTRSLDSSPVRSAPSQLPTSSPPSLTPTTVARTPDIHRLADQVYDLIEQKIKMQRDKRGFR
jgi:hypothetical protein